MDLKTIIVGGKDLTEKQEKIRKLFMYLVSGGITTVVNWVLYIVIDKLIQVDMTVDIIGKPVSLKFIINQIIPVRFKEMREIQNIYCLGFRFF